MDTQALYRSVMSDISRNRHVSPEDARRFLNNVFYGGFAQIDPALHKAGLAGLPLEAKLTLYESIAKEPNNPRIVWYLAALNESLELTDDFYNKFKTSVVDFLSSDSLRRIDAKHPKFMADYESALRNDPASSSQSKAYVLEALAKEYCARNGVNQLKLKFYEGQPENRGYSNNDEIGININSPEFKSNFAKTVKTLFHEITHKRAGDLGKNYISGKITRDHPDYIPARVFAAAQLTPGGYIQPDQGFTDYHDQPIEVHARAIGDAAEKAVKHGMAQKTLGMPEAGRPLETLWILVILTPANGNKSVPPVLDALIGFRQLQQMPISPLAYQPASKKLTAA